MQRSQSFVSLCTPLQGSESGEGEDEDIDVEGDYGDSGYRDAAAEGGEAGEGGEGTPLLLAANGHGNHGHGGQHHGHHHHTHGRASGLMDPGFWSAGGGGGGGVGGHGWSDGGPGGGGSGGGGGGLATAAMATAGTYNNYAPAMSSEEYLETTGVVGILKWPTSVGAPPRPGSHDDVSLALSPPPQPTPGMHTHAQPWGGRGCGADGEDGGAAGGSGGGAASLSGSGGGAAASGPLSVPWQPGSGAEERGVAEQGQDGPGGRAAGSLDGEPGSWLMAGRGLGTGMLCGGEGGAETATLTAFGSPIPLSLAQGIFFAFGLAEDAEDAEVGPFGCSLEGGGLPLPRGSFGGGPQGEAVAGGSVGGDGEGEGCGVYPESEEADRWGDDDDDSGDEEEGEGGGGRVAGGASDRGPRVVRFASKIEVLNRGERSSSPRPR